MKRMLLTLIVLFMMLTGYSQVISNFTWDSNPVTQATVGPNATSVSSVATSSPGGATNNGLNAGKPTTDINLIIPGSPYFDVPGIDISVDFRREEAVASFFKRGSNFDFGMNNGNLTAKFTISNGSNGTTVVNSGNVYAIPNDHKFHRYRFLYNSSTGKAYITVDGQNVYTYTGTAGRVLSWNNTGDITIGYQMDGTGNNVAILDNLLVQNVPVNAALPVKLTSFTAQAQNNMVVTRWTTTQEENMSGYVVERSADGISFTTLKTIGASGNYNTSTQYASIDSTPLSPVGYYRLKMVDIDGSFTYSDIRTVNMSSNTANVKVSCYPNPAIDHVVMTISNNEAAQYRYSVVSMDGKIQQTKTVLLQRGAQQVTVNLNNAAQGILFIKLENTNNNTVQSFKVIKN